MCYFAVMWVSTSVLVLGGYQACPWEWDSHGKCPMGWDGTLRIAFPMGPMGQ